MTISTICNGMICPVPHPYSEERIATLKEIIKQEREDIKSVYLGADHTNMLACGYRFGNDDIVLWTMQSANQEKLFENGDNAAVRDALTNCMSRDYWYMFEKDWGTPDPETDDYDEDE